MPKTNEYIARQSKNGEFSPRIRKEINLMLDMYCKINACNKTDFVNNVLESVLTEKFYKLKEEK